MRKIVRGSIVGLVVLLVLVGGYVYSRYDDYFVLPERRKLAAAHIGNPDGAKFRAEKITNAGWHCGEINIQNGQGAYVGFNRFMARAPDEVYIEGIGYAGRERSAIERTEALREHTLAEIKILDERRALFDKYGGAVEMSDSERSALAGKKVFEQRWNEACS